MNVWHDISSNRITAKKFEAFIEIPKEISKGIVAL